MNASLPSFDLASLWWLAGWTMLHYLWVGLAIGLLAAMARLLLGRAPANVRYAVALGTLSALAAAPLVIAEYVAANLPAMAHVPTAAVETLDTPGAVANPAPQDGTLLSPAPAPLVGPNAADVAAQPPVTIELDPNYRPPAAKPPSTQSKLTQPPTTSQPPSAQAPVVGISPEQPSMAPDNAAPSIAVAPSTFLNHLEQLSAQAAGYLPWLWLVGAPLTFALLATGLVGTERLRRHSRPITDGHIAELCASLAAAMHVTRRVSVAICQRISSPVLIGVVRPLILLPPAALTGWSPDELEMVLLHELAHVRRWDNLVNLLQRLVESILFFQPAVWWASRWIRDQRELCCDAAVVRHTRRPTDYARTLAALAAARRNPHAAEAALAAAGPVSAMARRQLVNRIRHILREEREPMQVTRKTLVFVLLVLLIAAVAATLVPTTRVTAQADDQPKTAAASDATPAADAASGKKEATKTEEAADDELADPLFGPPEADEEKPLQERHLESDVRSNVTEPEAKTEVAERVFAELGMRTASPNPDLELHRMELDLEHDLRNAEQKYTKHKRAYDEVVETSKKSPNSESTKEKLIQLEYQMKMAEVSLNEARRNLQRLKRAIRFAESKNASPSRVNTNSKARTLPSPFTASNQPARYAVDPYADADLDLRQAEIEYERCKSKYSFLDESSRGGGLIPATDVIDAKYKMQLAEIALERAKRRAARAEKENQAEDSNAKKASGEQLPVAPANTTPVSPSPGTLHATGNNTYKYFDQNADGSVWEITVDAGGRKIKRELVAVPSTPTKPSDKAAPKAPQEPRFELDVDRQETKKQKADASNGIRYRVAGPATGNKAAEKTTGQGGTLAEQLAVLKAQEALQKSRSSDRPITFAKSALRYDGKSYDQWSELWQTELNPARRADAVRALAAFSQAGYGRQAAEQIVEVMKQYDSSVVAGSATGKLIQAAQKALTSLDAEVRRPVITEALQSDNVNAQRFALYVLSANGITAESLSDVASKILQDEKADAKTRAMAASLFAGVDKSNEKVQAVLRKLMTDRQPLVAIAAIHALYPESKYFYGGGGFRGGGRISVPTRDEPCPPELLEALHHKNADVRSVAIQALGLFGPHAKDAVPVLLEMLKTDPTESFDIVITLGQIGPAAKDALPVLKELYEKTPPDDPAKQQLRGAIEEAVKKISPTGTGETDGSKRKPSVFEQSNR